MVVLILKSKFKPKYLVVRHCVPFKHLFNYNRRTILPFPRA